MAINDLTRQEIKGLRNSAHSSINSCKNQLSSVIDQTKTANVSSALLDRLGFNATEKTELANLRTTIEEIRDFIISKGF